MELEIPIYDVDYSKPVMGHGNFTRQYDPDLGCMIDKSIVQKKFELWNYVGKLGLLQGNFNTKQEKLMHYRAITLPLRDKTIYAYVNFKFNNMPMKMRYYQDIMLNDKHDRILFASSNQIGKSICLDVDAAVEFSIDHGKEWVGILVSKSLEQSKYQMDRIKQMLKSSNITYREESTEDTKTGKRDSVGAITFTFYDIDNKTPLYTNRLICCPPTGSALGYPTDRMWLDEFDWWENIDQNWFMQQVAIPRTIETNGAIIIFSNPNGKDKELYKLWNEKYEDGTYIWHRYNFNYWDKPGANQHQFNKITARMTRFQVDSTMLAVFSQSAGAFFSYEEIMDQIDKELCQKGDMAGYGRETAWFLDVGTVHDQSCLIGGYIEENPDNEEVPLIKAFWIHKYPVGYPLARVIGVDNQVDSTDGWEDDANDNPSVKEVLTEYGELGPDDKVFYPMFGCDVTGNSGLIPLFQSIGIDPIDITFSGKKKWNMYQRYQYYTQMRYFKRATDRDGNTVMGSDFTYQAQKLTIKKGTSTNYRQIHHESEDDLDDTQDTISALIYLIDNPDLPSLSFDIMNNQGKSMLKDIEDDKEKETLKKNNPELKGQYIPSYYNDGEMQSWMDQQKNYT